MLCYQIFRAIMVPKSSGWHKISASVLILERRLLKLYQLWSEENYQTINYTTLRFSPPSFRYFSGTSYHIINFLWFQIQMSKYRGGMCSLRVSVSGHDTSRRVASHHER